jgi:pyrroline-5-carboxylate reductase
MAENQITLVGCGKMGSAMLEGWLGDASLDAQFTIIEPDHSHLDWVSSEPRVSLYQDCAAAIADNVKASAMIVLAVKPQMMGDALAAIRRLNATRSAFLSIAAGISTRWLKQRLGLDAVVLRAMPNTPAAVGKGITALFADAQDPVRDLARQLLSAVGEVVMLDDEGLMDAVTAVSGSGPAYVFLLAEAMSAAGIKAGLPEPLAKELAKATVCGAGALMAAVDTPPATLRENVTSKGGTTAAALSVLMADAGLSQLMAEAVDAAKRRSIELGE